jgi:putative mRNA 3-end processing factor
LLGSYALGKAQRLIRLLSDYCPQRHVLVHHSIIGLNKIYEQFGFSLGKYELYTRKLMKNPDQNLVYIVPPLTFNSYIRAKNVVRAFASGWMNLQTDNDLKILISEHVEPRELWTLHGNGKHLKSYFKDQLTVKLLNHAD